jgi:excisionase family DNA binding protein
MFSFIPHVDSSEVVLEKHISVKAAAELSGYSIQYLRRLLRSGTLEGVKIGQVWLITLASLDAYLKRAKMLSDRRCGPREPIDEQPHCAKKALSTNVNVARQQM